MIGVKKKGLQGAECADGDNYWDRPLAEVTADVAYTYCFASCETECATGPSFAFPWSDNLSLDHLKKVDGILLQDLMCQIYGLLMVYRIPQKVEVYLLFMAILH